MSDERHSVACNDFEEFYNSENVRLRSAASSMVTLLELLLTDREGFTTPTVTGRVKECGECLSKFDRKYRKEAEAKEGSYVIRRYITDLIGLRVVCLYDDDVERVRVALQDEFEILTVTHKTKEIESHDDSFGYKGIHLDVRLRKPRSDLTEYKRFSDLQFEIQLRSTIQDSWSKIDHHINYKKDLQQELKRRINRLAALFELADQEFRLIRDVKASDTEPKLVIVPTNSDIEAGTDSRGLDEIAFLDLGRATFGRYPFDLEHARVFLAEMRRSKADATAVWLTEVLTKHADEIQAYKAYQRTAFMANMNPYTYIRHALYAEDKVMFKPLLFPRQVDSFDKWRRETQKESL